MKLFVLSVFLLVLVSLHHVYCEAVEETVVAATGVTGEVDPSPPVINPVDAIKAKNVALLSQYIAQGGNVNDHAAVSPLIMATATHFHEGMKLLVDHRANINIVEGDGWTPLMFACALGDATAVKLLLDYDANPFYESKTGHKSGFDYAVDNKHNEIARMVLDHSLIFAVKHRDFAPRIMDLVTKGANTKAKTSTGYTALLVQCSLQNVEAVKTLVNRYNVNYNEHENDGWNCLTFAAFLGNEPLVEFLLTLSHIDIGIALHRAEQRGHSAIAARIQRYVEDHQEGRDFSMAYSMKAAERTTESVPASEPEPIAAAPVVPEPEPEPEPEAPKEVPVAAAPAAADATPKATDADDAARRKQKAAAAALAAAEAAEKKTKEAAAARAANANDFKAAKASAANDKAKPGKTLFGWLFGNK